MNQKIRELGEINLQDFYSSLKITSLGLKSLLRPLYALPAFRFARFLEQFNRDVNSSGLKKASLGLLDRFDQKWKSAGMEEIPPEGPVLFLSNHPGMTDTLGLFSSIPRKDLKIIAADRPFLKALDSLEDRLILVPETGGFSALRPAVEYLSRGGTVLTFPAGRIEPDPALDPAGARLSRKTWYASPEFFRRMVPGLQIVFLEIAGVISPVWKRSSPGDKLPAVLQLLTMLYFPHLAGTRPVLSIYPRE